MCDPDRLASCDSVHDGGDLAQVPAHCGGAERDADGQGSADPRRRATGRWRPIPTAGTTSSDSGPAPGRCAGSPPYAFGPPSDRASAIGVLRAAVVAGVDHIDTAQYYGPGAVNDLIGEAPYPYPGGLAIVSKIAVRPDDRGAVLRPGDPYQLRVPGLYAGPFCSQTAGAPVMSRGGGTRRRGARQSRCRIGTRAAFGVAHCDHA
jgi:Aldo/keto reductase family